MSVKIYDDALLQKLQNWTKDTQLSIYGPDEVHRLFEMELDKNNDKPIKLPIIGLSRKGGYHITNLSKRLMSFDGFTLDATIAKSIQLNAIPISISYQLDIYTRYLEEADEIARNLVFNIINYPKLNVSFTYNNHPVVHTSNIRMEEEIVDNSSIPERLTLGQFTRLTISLTIDDAYLWDTRVRDNVQIEFEIIEDNDRDKINKK